MRARSSAVSSRCLDGVRRAGTPGWAARPPSRSSGSARYDSRAGSHLALRAPVRRASTDLGPVKARTATRAGSLLSASLDERAGVDSTVADGEVDGGAELRPEAVEVFHR